MSFKYQVNDLVACLHNGTFYEARITESRRFEDGGQYYEVHYVGWKKWWDEWVPLSYLKDVSEIGNWISPGPKSNKKKTQTAPQAQDGDLKQINLADLSITKDKGKTNRIQISEAPVSVELKEEHENCSDSALSAVISGLSGRKNGRKRTSKVQKVAKKIYVKYNKIDVSMPRELMLKLVNDYNNIIKKNMLIVMPVSKSVDKMLEEYLVDRCPSFKNDFAGENVYVSSFNFETIQPPKELQGKMKTLKDFNTDLHANTYLLSEFVKGMAFYFNLTLQTRLLYNFERTQLKELISKIGDKTNEDTTRISEIFNNNTESTSSSTENDESTSSSTNDDETPSIEYSSLYGPIHFLRLLTKFPSLFAHYNVDKYLIKLFVFYIEDLQAYLNEHRDDLFNDEQYIAATPDYLRRANL